METVKLVLVAVVSVLFVASVAVADPAVVISDEGCSLLDGNGNTVFTTDTHRVATASANENAVLTCKADVANDSGGTVKYSNANTGILCVLFTQTGAVVTDDWKETVSASGKATLQCRYKN